MSLKTEKLSDNVYDNIIAVKNILKLSVRRIASATNKASSMVGCYFNGTKNPPKDWIDKFCDIYCIDKDWLINGTDEPVFTGKPDISVISKSSSDGAGMRVRQVRKKAGLSQTEFGEKIGLSQTGIYAIERGTTNLTSFSAAKIEEQFNVGADWLMYGDEEKKDFPVSKKLIDWLWENEDVRKTLWERMIKTGHEILISLNAHE